jgi:hypothetical protein
MKRVTRLIKFLRSAQADAYFGKTFLLRADVLAHHLSGQGTLTVLAIKHRVTKSAMTRHARRAREIFGEPNTPKVDSR